MTIIKLTFRKPANKALQLFYKTILLHKYFVIIAQENTITVVN